MIAEELERERPYLFGVAYRILGSAADAEDVLQEAFVRARDITDVRSPRALLTTIVTRLCLDEVRSARRRHEGYVGTWLPEPIETTAPPADEPEEKVAAAESVSMAFLVLLEALSPLERAVFVLREVLDYEFAEIAEAVGRSEAACRQLLHRARAHVQAGRRHHATPDEQQGLAAAFLDALQSGDLDQLTRLLTADVVARTDHGGKATAARKDLVGPDRVSRFLAGLFGKLAHATGYGGGFAWINGAPGFVVTEDGHAFAALALELVDDGTSPRIAGIQIVRNPDKLAYLDRHLGHDRFPLAAAPG